MPDSARGVSGSSGLFYFGSGEEVSLGDRVRIKRVFRRDLDGKVCYIPGISPVHKELEYDDVQQWAIEGDNGSIYPILYDPEGFQPPSKIVFVGRAKDNGLQPDEVLE